MSGEAYPVPTAEYDKDKDPSGWYKTFQEFDADGSDAVDLEEVQKMVESLGLVVK
jgi:Ca2+-binding EF-hand superfamily protein